MQQKIPPNKDPTADMDKYSSDRIEDVLRLTQELAYWKRVMLEESVHGENTDYTVQLFRETQEELKKTLERP